MLCKHVFVMIPHGGILVCSELITAEGRGMVFASWNELNPEDFEAHKCNSPEEEGAPPGRGRGLFAAFAGHLDTRFPDQGH